MSHKLTIILLFLLFQYSFTHNIYSQTTINRTKAFEINQKLGRGINYGNMFEAPSETGWGNPWQPEYAKIISDLGFNHVRIPIRWEPSDRSQSNLPYLIFNSFLNRIKQVVDSALNNGLYVIINMHHHDALYEDPEGQKERFLVQWEQIANYFKEYPDSLLFEILNEPHGNLTAEKWNIFSTDALTEIRETNPDRIVLIGTPEYGGLGGLPKLQIPSDENIILTAHYYNPFQFTHQGASWVGSSADDWLGTTWDDTKTDREVVKQEFSQLVKVSNDNNIPVHIGEFGAYSKADIVSRGKWTTYLSRYFESLGWSWAYWEFSAGFGIYDRNSKSINQTLVDALLHNETPEPARYEGIPVYSSDFQNSNDGWNLYKQGTAEATISMEDNSLVATILSGSNESWHIQIVKGNVSLRADKKYKLSFKAKAASERTAKAYVGQSSSPWTSYSGYSSISLTDTFEIYSMIFDMKSDDYSARIVFDLGTSTVDFTVTEIKLEEIVLVTPTGYVPENKIEPSMYPNPCRDNLFIQNAENFHIASIYNYQGYLIESFTLNSSLNCFDLKNIPCGMYILKLFGKTGWKSLKIIKS